jgi:glycosyltransferase involved in cell wall biosynthesis
MNENERKMVSVIIITYRQEAFIAEAIESIMCQKANFPFEVVIGEDSSPDNTRAICEQYVQKYPEHIRLLPLCRNTGSMDNFLRTLDACKGKYVALCEGDDYWCDTQKLQKQVDFLEANPDFTICFTSAAIKDEMGWCKPDAYYFPKPEKDVFTIEDFILSEMNIIPTATIMFKNVLPYPLPNFYRKAMVGDMGLQLFAADKGKAKWLNETTAVYRNHGGGVTKSEAIIKKADAALMQFFHSFNKFTQLKYDNVFRKRFLENAKMKLIFGASGKRGLERVRHYFERMPGYLKYRDKWNLKELLYYHYVLLFPSLLKKRK